jgi:hypothetical protein
MERFEVMMTRMPGLAAASLLVALNVTGAQTPAPSDTAPNAVTAVSIKSGKLALSSAANPGPVFLPDGAYTNESNTTIVFLDGRILRVEHGSGTVDQVGSVRIQRDRVMLTPSVRALMAVSPFALPSGTFRSQDGNTWFKVESGRPTEFALAH